MDDWMRLGHPAYLVCPNKKALEKETFPKLFVFKQTISPRQERWCLCIFQR